MRGMKDVRVLLGGALLAGSVTALATALSGALLSSPPAAAPASASALSAHPAADPSPAPAPAEEAPNPSVAKAAMALLAEDVVGEAAEKAPFDPDRRAPSGRYRLPEEFVVEEPPPPPPPPPPAPEFRVLGIIGGAGGGVAVIEVDGEPPRVVSLGEDVLGYNLASIGNRRVVVSKDGRNVSVAMSDPMPTTMATAPANGRGQAQRGGRNGQGQGNARGNQTIEIIRGTERGSVTVDLPEAQERLQQARDRIQRAQEEESRNQGNQGRNGGNQGGRGGQQPARPRPPGGR